MTRVMLDEHVSGRVIGRALRESGHDVRTADSDPTLSGLPDHELLALSIRETRVLVTVNAKDFSPLTTRLIIRGESHAGLVLLPEVIRERDFGWVIQGSLQLFEEIGQEAWINRTEWLQRQ